MSGESRKEKIRACAGTHVLKGNKTDINICIYIVSALH